jgi:hypothetical protein
MVPDIVEFLAKTMNFTYDLGFPRDGSWGAFNKDTGEWSGIIRDIFDGDVDVGFAPLTVLHERAEAVDFLIPIHSDKSTFVVSQELSFNNAYTTTFNSDLWTMIAVFGIILSLALALIVKIGRDQQSSAFLLEQCFIYSSGALCGFKAKGWYTTPVSVSARSGILNFCTDCHPLLQDHLHLHHHLWLPDPLSLEGQLHLPDLRPYSIHSILKYSRTNQHSIPDHSAQRLFLPNHV